MVGVRLSYHPFPSHSSLINYNYESKIPYPQMVQLELIFMISPALYPDRSRGYFKNKNMTNFITMKTIEFTTINRFLGNAYWLTHLFYQLTIHYNQEKLAKRKNFIILFISF